MKALYLTTMYPVPAFPQQGIFCHEQVKALKALGHDVTVAVPIPFYSTQRETGWCYEGVNIHYIRFFKLPGARDFHNTGKALYRSLKRRLDLSAFDLYHADAPLPSGHAAMLAARKYGKPFVVHGHGLDVFLDGSYAGLPNCEKIARACALVYEQANAVIGVSQKVLQRIQARVDVAGKAFVAYNGVDTEKFHPVPREVSEYVNLTAIGNLIPLKGHDDTLRALRALIDRGYDRLRLTVAGRGREEASLKLLAAELGLSDHVRFMGYIPYMDVAKLLRHTDIFVLPSYYEALGCVYLEAMACGVPAVGCRENGIDEVIEQGRTGFLVGSRNTEELTDCLEKLMDPQLRRELGINARRAVAEAYQWKHSAAAVTAAYEYCLGGAQDGL